MSDRIIFNKIAALIIASGFLVPAGARGQGTGLDPALSTGNRSAIYHGTDIETVDTMSGNLRIALPLLHLPGRSLDMDIGLVYNSKIWMSSYQPPPHHDPDLPPGPASVSIERSFGNTTISSSTLVGWNIGVPKMGVATRNAGTCVEFDTVGNCARSLATATWVQNDGTLILLSSESSIGGPTIPSAGYSSFADGNFALLTSRGLLYQDGTLANSFVDSNSVLHQTLEDTNGNLLTCTGSSQSFLFTSCIDTLGRMINITADGTFHYPQTMAYLDSSGTSRSTSFSYTSFTVRYPFGGTNGSCIQSVAPSVTLPLLTGVTLANNVAYRFEYLLNADGPTTGEISKIVLPTGGYIRYTYDFAPLSDNNFLNGCGSTQMIAQNRMVTQRFVSTDGTSASEQRWTYGATIQVVDGKDSIVMKVTDPLGNSVTYARDALSPSPVHHTDYMDASGRIVKIVKGVVELGSGDGTSSDPNGGTPRYKSLTTILPDTNQQSQTTYTYGTYNHVIEKDETDWGVGAPGGILRKTTFTYLTDLMPSYASDSVHIFDRVTGEAVCDAGSTFCSRSTTSYDTTAIASTANNPVTQHDYTNYPYTNTLRGNTSQISRVLNTGSNVVTTSTYNEDRKSTRLNSSHIP